MGRKNRKGTLNTANTIASLLQEQKTLLKKSVTELSEKERTNIYKVKGEIITRQMRLPSFIRKHPKGKFLVFVAKHALAVIDGKLIDTGFCSEQHPNHRVLRAFRVS